MNSYVLFCYDGRNWCEYTSNTSLKALKNMIAEQRNDNGLRCAMYIRNNTRIVKRYKAV